MAYAESTTGFNGDRGPTITIVGTGITGLLTAHGLKKNGFPVVLFDRDNSVDARPRDWTILIHWALPIMERLLPPELMARLAEAMTTPHLNFTPEVETFPCYSGKTGELLFASKTSNGRRVTRQRLRKLLIEGLEDNIRWGKELVGISQASTTSAVRLEFEDGSAHEADFVLGADGASSVVRGHLLGPERAKAARSGCMLATGVVNYNDEAKVQAIVDMHPLAAIMMGSGAVALVGVMRANDIHVKASWSTFWMDMWQDETVNLKGQEAIDFMKTFVREHPERYCEPFGSAIKWTPDGSLCGINDIKYWIPVPWDNCGGRITLAGDACHPMLPFRGQGLQMAIVDASNYLDAMIEIRKCGKDSSKVGGIMEAFEAEMIPRGAEAVKQSLEEAAKAMDPGLIDKMLMATRGHGRIQNTPE